VNSWSADVGHFRGRWGEEQPGFQTGSAGGGYDHRPFQVTHASYRDYEPMRQTYPAECENRQLRLNRPIYEWRGCARARGRALRWNGLRYVSNPVDVQCSAYFHHCVHMRRYIYERRGRMHAGKGPSMVVEWMRAKGHGIKSQVTAASGAADIMIMQANAKKQFQVRGQSCYTASATDRE